MLAEDGPLHPMHDDDIEDKVYRRVEGWDMYAIRTVRYGYHTNDTNFIIVNFISLFSFFFPIFGEHFCSSKQRRCTEALAPFKVPVAATASEMRR